MDKITKEQRSHNMSMIRSSNTKPELLFRKYIWNRKIRGYRINYKIKSRPDVYFPKKKIAIFIDGCFWHKCQECYARPKSNNEYWDRKIENNVIRDDQANQHLKDKGISVIRFWEREISKDIVSCFTRFMDVYSRTDENN